jgi:hypothetical protein
MPCAGAGRCFNLANGQSEWHNQHKNQIGNQKPKVNSVRIRCGAWLKERRFVTWTTFWRAGPPRSRRDSRRASSAARKATSMVSPQCRHLRAPARIGSAQKGQSLWESTGITSIGASAAAGTTAAIREETAVGISTKNRCRQPGQRTDLPAVAAGTEPDRWQWGQTTDRDMGLAPRTAPSGG